MQIKFKTFGIFCFLVSFGGYYRWVLYIKYILLYEMMKLKIKVEFRVVLHISLYFM